LTTVAGPFSLWATGKVLNTILVVNALYMQGQISTDFTGFVVKYLRSCVICMVCSIYCI